MYGWTCFYIRIENKCNIRFLSNTANKQTRILPVTELHISSEAVMISGNSCMRKWNLFRKIFFFFLLKLINELMSLLLCHMWRTPKRGVINSLIKKQNVDQCDLTNYYPISNFHFISKLLNSSLALQLCPLVHRNDICEMFWH